MSTIRDDCIELLMRHTRNVECRAYMRCLGLVCSECANGVAVVRAPGGEWKHVGVEHNCPASPIREALFEMQTTEDEFVRELMQPNLADPTGNDPPEVPQDTVWSEAARKARGAWAEDNPY